MENIFIFQKNFLCIIQLTVKLWICKKIDSVLCRPCLCEKHEEKKFQTNFPSIDSVAFSQVLTVCYEVLQNKFILKSVQVKSVPAEPVDTVDMRLLLPCNIDTILIIILIIDTVIIIIIIIITMVLVIIIIKY